MIGQFLFPDKSDKWAIPPIYINKAAAFTYIYYRLIGEKHTNGNTHENGYCPKKIRMKGITLKRVIYGINTHEQRLSSTRCNEILPYG